MKLAKKLLEAVKKLDPSKKDDFKGALAHASNSLGKAKVKYAEIKKNKGASVEKVLDAKQNVEFWQQRVQDITARLKA